MIRRMLLLALFSMPTVNSLAATARPTLSAPSTWPPEVVKAYQAVLATPTTGGSAVATGALFDKLRVLAETGVARDAMGTIAFNPALPLSHRSLAGQWYAQYYRFDPTTLLTLAEDDNVFVAQQAFEELVDLGGQDLAPQLRSLAARRAFLAPKLRRREAQLIAIPRLRFMLKQLDILLQGPRDKKGAAALMLRRAKVDTVTWGLEQMLSPQGSTIIDSYTQDLAAAVLVDHRTDSVPGLVALTARRNNDRLRSLAMKQLAKSPAGKTALRGLSLVTDDPLKKEWEALTK